MLIKPLIFCIERRYTDVYDFHLADGPVAAAGLNEDGGKRFDRYFLAVQLHLAGPFEDEVDFGQLFMVMHLRVGPDINDVHRCSGIVRHGKRPFCKAARTRNGVNLVKMCNHIVCHTLSFQNSGQAVGVLKTVELSIESLYILPDVCDFIKTRVRINIMSDLFDLKDKTIVITGGGGVLCGTMAVALGQAGAKIAVLDLLEVAAAEVADEIQSAGGQAIAVKCNVLDKVSLQTACKKINAELGKIDVLINGAGGNKKEATTSSDLSFFDLPSDAIRLVFDLNFLGTLLPTQVFGKEMAERGAGVILNVSSMNAFRPLTKIAAYSAAKAAVSNFTQWLAVHVCQNYSKDIRVNAIAPGFFLTEQNRFLLTDEKTGELTARGKTIIEHTPMGRFGRPEELIGTVMWLLSDAAKFVTGIVVPVDGGFSAFSGV